MKFPAGTVYTNHGGLSILTAADVGVPRYHPFTVVPKGYNSKTMIVGSDDGPKDAAGKSLMDGQCLRLDHTEYDETAHPKYPTSKAERDSYVYPYTDWGSHCPVYDTSFSLSYDVCFTEFKPETGKQFQWFALQLRLQNAQHKINTWNFTKKDGENTVTVRRHGSSGDAYAVGTIDLNRKYNLSFVFDVSKSARKTYLYIDGVYVDSFTLDELSAIDSRFVADNFDKNRTGISFGWDSTQGEGIAYLDNIEFKNNLPQESFLSNAAIEAIDEAVKIDCINDDHADGDRFLMVRLLPGTYTFKLLTPTTAEINLNTNDLPQYYGLLDNDSNHRKAEGDAVTKIMLKFDGSEWVLDAAAQLYVTCNEDAPAYYSVTYTDGLDGRAFAAIKIDDILEGSNTPIYAGVPQCAGYQFLGWSPLVTKIVTCDVVYTARWREISVFRPALGSAMLTVTDPNGAPVAGAKFELHRVTSSGKDTVLSTHRTDKDGMILLYANPKNNTGLSPNSSYYWKQVTAPLGYRIAEKKLSFSVRYGFTVKLKLVNEKSGDETAKTPYDFSENFEGYEAPLPIIRKKNSVLIGRGDTGLRVDSLSVEPKIFSISIVNDFPLMQDASGSNCLKMDRRNYKGTGDRDCFFSVHPAWSSDAYGAYDNSFSLAYDVCFNEFAATKSSLIQWDVAALRLQNSDFKVFTWSFLKDKGSAAGDDIKVCRYGTPADAANPVTTLKIGEKYSILVSFDVVWQKFTLTINGTLVDSYDFSEYVDFTRANNKSKEGTDKDYINADFDSRNTMTAGWSGRGTDYTGTAYIDNIVFRQIP